MIQLVYMNKLFYIDGPIAKTWEEFIADVNSITAIEKYIKKESYYDIFVHIVASILSGVPIELLDSDFSSQEVFALTNQTDVQAQVSPIKRLSIQDKASLLDSVRAHNSSWSVAIYTSGTTGLPKKVVHSLDTITRFVQVSAKHKQSVWGFAYNPTHMAGLQVFFQALFNGNTIVRLFQLSRNEIFEQIQKYDITNISATPTFYRMLLPCQLQFQSVVRLTSGGERFDGRTTEQLISIFPNAKITNVYASTEIGTLFAADGDVFEIKESLADKVKIDQGELLIHRSLMGEMSGNTSTDQWYRTKDLVEVISQTPCRFKFISRQNEMINIGGYKVNPNEVEQVMRSYPGINDVRVYGKKNAIMGSVIIADVVTSELIEETDIRLYLKDKLQEHKIPRMFIFKDKIEQTRTGKLKR